MSLVKQRVFVMIYRLRQFDRRVEEAFSLWAGFGYSWREAWRMAGGW